jgi:hypothetical protein
MHRLDDITRAIALSDAVPVAANSANASTVAFVHDATDDSDATLYVAATYTTEPYREAAPAVCARTLDEQAPFRLVDPGDVRGQSGLLIRSEYRADYRVHYVGGFTDTSFAYWTSVQKRSPTDSTYVSKVLRVCLDDKR